MESNLDAHQAPFHILEPYISKWCLKMRHLPVDLQNLQL